MSACVCMRVYVVHVRVYCVRVYVCVEGEILSISDTT